MKTLSLAQWEEGDIWAGYKRATRILTDRRGGGGRVRFQESGDKPRSASDLHTKCLACFRNCVQGRTVLTKACRYHGTREASGVA